MGSPSCPGSFVFDNPENTQQSEPVRGIGYYERTCRMATADEYTLWLFKNRLVKTEPPYEFSYSEIVLSIKHIVMTQEESFRAMKRDIERVSRLEQLVGSQREPIPRDVRVFVWQRDEGRCVQCSSPENLEYDHIVPIARGGSNTERNIQLLCEPCNREKGAEI